MNIIETQIPDVTNDNIISSKGILADNIIKNVYPLFDNVYSEKLEESKHIKLLTTKKRNELKVQKENIEQLIVEYKRKKKIAKLIDRLDKLVEAGLVYDGTLKHETVILLKIIDRLPLDKLDQQIAKTVQMINKRFSR